ncbi:nucleotidyltransferase family protein [Anaeromicropila herbilytica]|uniref:Nucleotidyltransferase n=1 Tax=Anaeromicropila herbilytica TaxID=2785025 RepID=A0A7R7IFL3_9FIRM|nr:nucleotidyltransferase [Anaeromicropila herbilytica]BCN32258.1 nucleotidyltransferase [Anaeromicropila herbilytica]
MKATLVIMAAGLGSRYGGIKQLEKIGPNGEILIDYSIYDAIKAGFKKIVFIIRKDIEEEFKEVVGNRISKIIETEYVIQDINELPDGYEKPSDRTKPWGTGHAILSCYGKITDPFVVINADDYYGSDAFTLVYNYLCNPKSSMAPYEFCMAGFILGNTLSPNGGVTRGICQVGQDDILVDVNETSGIKSSDDGAVALDSSGQIIPVDINSIVSMNMWGFTPDIFKELKIGFPEFLSHMKDNLQKAEYLLPNIVSQLVQNHKARVKVLKTMDKWVGVTYKEDKGYVVETIQELIKDGVYPESLYMK